MVDNLNREASASWDSQMHTDHLHIATFITIRYYMVFRNNKPLYFSVIFSNGVTAFTNFGRYLPQLYINTKAARHS